MVVNSSTGEVDPEEYNKDKRAKDDAMMDILEEILADTDTLVQGYIGSVVVVREKNHDLRLTNLLIEGARSYEEALGMAHLIVEDRYKQKKGWSTLLLSLERTPIWSDAYNDYETEELGEFDQNPEGVEGALDPNCEVETPENAGR